jgi:hypothetical protein
MIGRVPEVTAVPPIPLDDLSQAYRPRRGGLGHTLEGAKAGALAGSTVIAVLLLSDLLRLTPLTSSAILSSAVVGQPIQVTPGLETAMRVAEVVDLVRGVGQYLLLHFAAFAALGVGAAYLFDSGRITSNVLSGALYGVLACSGVFYAGLMVRAGSLVAAPDWRIVLAANAVAGVIMVAHLLGEPDPGQ